MRAMRYDRTAPIESQPLRLVEVSEPTPGPGEIRLRVEVCGVCRTDLHLVEGDLPTEGPPRIPGHQVVGQVDRLGRGVQRFRVGERAGIAWLRATCGDCLHCRRGEENLCPASRYTGLHADGGYAEYAVVPEAFAYAIPSGFASVEAAPLLCAGIIGYRALRRSEVPAGGRLGLYGFGSSAHLVLQAARARGCEVYVATRGASHRRLALELGALWVGEAEAVPPVPLDGAILFAPAGELVLPALRALRRGGTLVTAGVTLTRIPPMSYEEHLFHEKRITSVEANTRQDGEDLLREASRIPIRPKTVEFPLEDANCALRRLKEDGFEGTAVLRVSKESS